MLQSRSILVVGEEGLEELVQDACLNETFGFSVFHEANPGRALERTRSFEMGIVAMLVHGHRDGYGAELCRAFRRSGVDCPIIILAHSSDESEIVASLDAGADDYVVVPCSTVELAARIRAHSRAYQSIVNAEITLGSFTFRPGTRELIRKGHARSVRLTDRESALLLFLCRSRGRPIPRVALLKQVWGYSSDAATHTVETHIYRLRRKFAGCVECKDMIVNEDGGYALRLNESRLGIGHHQSSVWQGIEGNNSYGAA